MPDTGRLCAMCGNQLRSTGRGRPARFCSAACRERAYRERVARIPGDRSTEALHRPAQGTLTLDAIVTSAVAVADRDGVDALSMRRTAEHLGCGVMSLYRHVSGKDQLIDAVVDWVFRSHRLPEPGPDHWRDRLELSARMEWAIYTERPWVASLVASTARPPMSIELLTYTDWRMRAVDGHGLAFTDMVRIAVALSTHVLGSAIPLVHEMQNPNSHDQWVDSRRGDIAAAFASGRLPMVSQFGADEFAVSRPDAVFEFGLERTLDGFESLLLRAQ